MNGMDASLESTPELASRMAVVAVTAGVEPWARTVSVDGRVGLQDLTRTLEVIRLAAAAEPDAYHSVDGNGRPEANVGIR